MGDDCEFDVALPSLGKKTREMRCVSPERMGELLAAEAEADRDALAAVIEQVRALHRQVAGSCDHCCIPCDGYCRHDWPCPTAALLPPTEEQP